MPLIVRGQDPRKFDQWGDISFIDEKARLDNIALQLRLTPDQIAYLVIFAGRTSCIGEGRARGIRARNYLVHRRGVKPRQVIWIDGGYQQSVTTDVWIWPRDMRPPAQFHESSVNPNELTLNRNCRIKCRACRR